MGFLSRWTRPAWEKERERGDRAWQRGDAAGARISWSKALDDAPDEVAAELRPRIAEASARLAAAKFTPQTDFITPMSPGQILADPSRCNSGRRTWQQTKSTLVMM